MKSIAFALATALALNVAGAAAQEKIDTVNGEANQYIKELEARYDEKVDRLRKGDELPPGLERGERHRCAQDVAVEVERPQARAVGRIHSLLGPVQRRADGLALGRRCLADERLRAGDWQAVRKLTIVR